MSANPPWIDSLRELLYSLEQNMIHMNGVPEDEAERIEPGAGGDVREVHGFAEAARRAMLWAGFRPPDDAPVDFRNPVHEAYRQVSRLEAILQDAVREGARSILPNSLDFYETIFMEAIDAARKLDDQGSKDEDSHQEPPAPVVLGKSSESVTVNGKGMPKLTATRYRVVRALLQAGDGGLSKGELVEQSGHGDAVNILKRLAKSDPDWKEVILLAGKAYGRYRIKS